jgi:hypothetical protein
MPTLLHVNVKTRMSFLSKSVKITKYQNGADNKKMIVGIMI